MAISNMKTNRFNLNEKDYDRVMNLFDGKKAATNTKKINDVSNRLKKAKNIRIAIR